MVLGKFKILDVAVKCMEENLLERLKSLGRKSKKDGSIKRAMTLAILIEKYEITFLPTDYQIRMGYLPSEYTVPDFMGGGGDEVYEKLAIMDWKVSSSNRDRESFGAEVCRSIEANTKRGLLKLKMRKMKVGEYEHIRDTPIEHLEAEWSQKPISAAEFHRYVLSGLEKV